MHNILIIVEGKDLELNVMVDFSKKILDDFEIVTKIHDDKKNADLSSYFVVENAKNRIFIVKPKHNRLSEILNCVRNDEDAFIHQKSCSVSPDFFEKTFLVLDVDYATKDEIKEALDIFNDEHSRGLLVLSCPCIESCSDFERKKFELSANKSINSTYKPFVAKQLIEKRLLAPPHQKAAYYIKKNYLYCLNDCVSCNYERYKNGKSYINHQNVFLNKDAPYKENDKIIFPYPTSFLYILFGLLEENPKKKFTIKYLQGFLERFI